MALSPNADPGNETAVLKFHRVGHQQQATRAVHELIANLTSGETEDTAGRILVISGQAGTGKTHLVVNELRNVPASVTPIVIFSPDRWKEFDPWLDEQVITSLLQTKDRDQDTDALTALSSLLIAAAFGEKEDTLAKLSKRLETDWGENPTREVMDSLRDAGRALIVHYVPVGALVDNALSVAFGSRDRALMHAATAMRDQLRLASMPDAEDFCAAMLLCQTPYAQSAYHWLSQKSVPTDVLPKVRKATSRFSTFRCIAKALAQLDRQVVLCFDQLERVALDASDGDSKALKQLIQESLQVLRSQKNVGCIVSALTDIVDRTMRLLPQPDRDRVEQEPGIQSLRNLSLEEAEAFFAPRIAHIAEEHPQIASEVVSFISWVKQNSPSRRIPPRFLLRGAMISAKQTLGGAPGSARDYERIWAETTKQLSERGPDIVEVATTAPPQADVETEWQRVKSEGGELGLLPRAYQEVVDLVGWALSALSPAISGSGVVSGVQKNIRKRPEVDYTITTGKGAVVQTRLYLVNEPNYRGKLIDQMKSLKGAKFAGRKIAFRTRDSFPVGSQSKAKPSIDDLKKAGFILVDMTSGELVTLLQLKKLAGLVPQSAFESWLARRLLTLSAMARLLTP